MANAAIVGAGTGGAISTYVNYSTDLLIDINGYFLDKDSGIPAGYHYLGVVGTVDPNGGLPYGVLFAQNLSSGLAYSIKADISNTNSGSAAIAGRQLAGSGVNYGLLGVNLSNAATAAGVRGELSGVGTGYGVIGVASTPTSNYGVFSQGNFGGTGSKSFVEPHPTDPSLVIRYTAMEGRESGTYFRGRARFQDRVARIPVPEDFRIVTDPEGLTVQVTPIGGPASTWVASMGLDEIVLSSTDDVEFSYLVQGVRKAFRDFVPISPGSEFMPESATAVVPAWLTDEAKQRLIANGTYNPDGSVNMSTARRLGWDQIWQPQAP